MASRGKKSKTAKAVNKAKVAQNSKPAWFNDPEKRPLIVLAVIAVVGAAAILFGNLFANKLSFTSQYVYDKNGASFSFRYPVEFTDTTKPTIYGDRNTVVAQQSKKNPNGALIGYVRGSFVPPSNYPSSDLAALRTALRTESAGDIQAFKKAAGSSIFADCAHAKVIEGQQGSKLLQCGLPDLGDDSFKGAVLFGVSDAGSYEFDFWFQKNFWQEHAGDWDAVYTSTSYK